MTSRAILVAVVFSDLVVGGQATAEIIDGKKLLADCQDGDNPNARESTTKWGTCFGYMADADATPTPHELTYPSLRNLPCALWPRRRKSL
jgi:hypothetical protein